jgi:copper/silver efflux system protein
VNDLQSVVRQKVRLSPGVSVAYAGQFEYLQRAAERLKLVVPATLLTIFVLLYLIFRRFDEAALIMATLPFALTGYHQSVATGVGFIALAGVSAEFGVVMLIYLKHALDARGPDPDGAAIAGAVREGALLRVRPKAMTVAVILAGLFPILIGHGAGSEIMSRIAAPMIGGMITAPLLSMLVIPAGFLLLRRRTARRRPLD